MHSKAMWLWREQAKRSQCKPHSLCCASPARRFRQHQQRASARAPVGGELPLITSEKNKLSPHQTLTQKF